MRTVPYEVETILVLGEVNPAETTYKIETSSFWNYLLSSMLVSFCHHKKKEVEKFCFSGHQQKDIEKVIHKKAKPERLR